MKYKGRAIIKVQGGLGNQMFQYALYKKLQKKGYRTSLDVREYNVYKMHNGFEIIKIFNINPHTADNKDLNLVLGTSKQRIFNLRKKIFGLPKCYMCEGDTEGKYNSQIYNKTKMYLDGYWQTEKYFKDIRNELLDDFKVDLTEDSRSSELIQEMKQCNSVSVHIRRGDYITNPEANKLHGNITTMVYYRNAIEKIYSQVDNPKFYIFSDDIEWGKENFKGRNMIFIEYNKGKDSYKDMILMSKCQHNIIANSSFSWWGAWLNTNPDKIVIAPDRWFNNMEAPDILPEEWIKVSIR